MSTHKLINRAILFAFLVLVGYSLAKSIVVGSTIGLLLALTSLGAGIYFIHLLVKMKAELERER